MSEPFIAEIRIFTFNFAPRGWAFCNGQLLPIAQNTALFSLIGTTYGGDGRTTTALPDLQGRAAMQPRQGPGLTDRRLGQKGGTESERLTDAQMPNHTHQLTATERDGRFADPANKYLATGNQMYSSASPDTSLAPESLQEAGGAGETAAHTNMQPYQAVNFCIALQGLYPSRS